MTKLEETMMAHPEMTPFEITRIEVAKLAEPVQRAALIAVVDLVQAVVTGFAEEVREAHRAYDAKVRAEEQAKADAGEAAKAAST